MQRVAILLFTLLEAAALASGALVHVDDNAPNDPGPGNHTVSDPLEDGTPEHPFDAIQEALDAAQDGDEISVEPGIFNGLPNRDLQWNAATRHLTVRGNGQASECIIDCENAGRGFILNSGQDNRDLLANLTIRNGRAAAAPIPDSTDTTGGGAVLCNGTSPRIIACTLQDNTAYSSPCGTFADGGAIDVTNGGSPLITKCLVQGNTATHTGGGIHSYGSSPVIISNTIIGNLNKGCYGGGGVGYVYNSHGTLCNNLIADNTAYYYSDGGYGAGVVCMNSNPDIINNTVARNSTWRGSNPGEGGGIRIRGLPCPKIRNCILWGNSSSAGLEDLDFQYSWVLDIAYSDVGIGLGTVNTGGAPGNISANPLFRDAGLGDYRLSDGSPCTDAGDNTAMPAGTTTDLAGNLRFINDPAVPDTGNGTPPIIDMGAYENLPLIADYNNDGDVDLGDFGIFEPCLTGTNIPLNSGCEDKDFDSDNDVDQSDFGIFQRCLSGQGNPANPNCIY